jgi:Ca2+-binding RTX toxin-like protein
MANIFAKNPNGDIIDAADGVTNGHDVIVGNAGKDMLFGLGGNDVLKGGGGADLLDGGSGIDAAVYDDSPVGVQVSLQLGKGTGGTAQGDTLISIENLYGSDHDDLFVGDTGANQLVGGAGNDVLKGGGGADRLLGGDGSDTLVADGLNDKFDGGDGIDTVDLSASAVGLTIDFGWKQIFADDVITTFGEWSGGIPDIQNVENVIGTQQDDYFNFEADNINAQLSGNGGDDYIVSGTGNDTLDGGAGDDMLDGGSGADALIGGTGADTFDFEWVSDSVVTNGAVQDVIADFTSGVDKIYLGMNFQFADLLTLNQSQGGANTSYLGLDVNHNGQFDNGEFAVAIKMVGNHFLSAGDLIM